MFLVHLQFWEVVVAEVEIPTPGYNLLIKTTIRKLRLYKFILVTFYLSTPFIINQHPNHHEDLPPKH